MNATQKALDRLAQFAAFNDAAGRPADYHRENIRAEIENAARISRMLSAALRPCGGEDARAADTLDSAAAMMEEGAKQ